MMLKNNQKRYETKSLIDFYEQNIKTHGGGFGSVAWGSKESQEKRFVVLAQIDDLNQLKILDVGCGLGDFYGWLKARNIDIHYEGIDITPSMIQEAKKKYPGVRFKVQDILKEKEIDATFDYIFASGIFNRKIPEHHSFVSNTIIRMFDLCRRGIAFNIMSEKADFMEPEEYYADPGEMLNICLGLSRKVILRHDYMPHDFTVYIYK